MDGQQFLKVQKNLFRISDIRKKTELSTHKGCILWGSRVVVPPTYQNQILKLLHGYHPGINLMKAYSRSYVWWPNLDKQIELEVKRCDQCQTNKGNPPAAPRQFIKPPEDPWNTLHIDFAGPFQGCTFLVIVDHMSKWLEVKIVRNLSSTEVKNKLRQVFGIHGQPKRIISDNGTAFVSAKMQQFYTLNGIKFNLTAPYHPSSNEQAERMAQYLKTSLKTMSEGDMQTKLQRVLFKQHTTPNTTTGKTPAELLMGRRFRTALDAMHPDDGQINPVSPDSSFGQVRSFKIGDTIYFRNYSIGPLWLEGEIIEVTGPVSYVVKSTDNKIGRCHIDQIKRRLTNNQSRLTDSHTFQIPFKGDDTEFPLWTSDKSA
ncbi:uncharacterized protein K02A2.6-like [Eupeodes corollae]|uniref:uncharacterized protein K02A2.6-like n=1 Tax=Eupeodes corollae TaxID=290404 RepID=UPI002492515B|nr:uncharacterized protein K02A2.6-like [Eupeodes corollae]